jgi:orotate phosphoribosyltransferase
MSARPRIAVIMDENTSVDGTRYDMTKNYFVAIHKAGGMPFGTPYFMDMVNAVVDEFDGFVDVGGRFAFPDDWFIDGLTSKAPSSERLEVELALMRGFLERDKPVLGICNGMQVLAALHGCRLSPDVRAMGPHIIEHDKRGRMHPVLVKENTLLSRIVGQRELSVNTFHREAVVEVSSRVVASAYAEDGLVEAVEVPSYRFALGVQWHPDAACCSRAPRQRNFRGVRASDEAGLKASGSHNASVGPCLKSLLLPNSLDAGESAMTQNEVLEEFRSAGALLEGHFVLSSGLHSPVFLQKMFVFQDPARTERVCKALADKIKQTFGAVDYVVSPAVGGIVPGYETARHLGAKAIFVERENGAFTLRRGFTIPEGARVVMVEDIVTTGLSSRECLAALKEYPGTMLGAASLIDRSGGKADLGVPLVSLVQLDIPAYEPDKLPPELAALPATKPGSRSLKS